MPFTREQLAGAFNEWLHRFEESPTRFEAEFETVRRFAAERADGFTPSYGETCVAYPDTPTKPDRRVTGSPPGLIRMGRQEDSGLPIALCGMPLGASRGAGCASRPARAGWRPGLRFPLATIPRCGRFGHRPRSGQASFSYRFRLGVSASSSCAEALTPRSQYRGASFRAAAQNQARFAENPSAITEDRRSGGRGVHG